MPIRFEWDADKAVGNLRKHRVSFELAIRVFYDPFALVEQDRIEGGEYRWQTLGWSTAPSCCWSLTPREWSPKPKSSESYQHDVRSAGKGDDMNTRTVSRTIDLANPEPLGAEQRAELEALKAMPDDDIDTSDISPLTESFWQKAVHNPFYKPTKTSTTIRLDSDVLAWFRSQGKGYQSRINAVLRREMLTSLKS